MDSLHLLLDKPDEIPDQPGGPGILPHGKPDIPGRQGAAQFIVAEFVRIFRILDDGVSEEHTAGLPIPGHAVSGQELIQIQGYVRFSGSKPASSQRAMARR